MKNADLYSAEIKNINLSLATVDGIIGKHIASISNIGTFDNVITYLPEVDTVWANCWNGTLEEYKEEIHVVQYILEKLYESETEEFKEQYGTAIKSQIKEELMLSYDFFKLKEKQYKDF